MFCCLPLELMQTDLPKLTDQLVVARLQPAWAEPMSCLLLDRIAEDPVEKPKKWPH